MHSTEVILLCNIQFSVFFSVKAVIYCTDLLLKRLCRRKMKHLKVMNHVMTIPYKHIQNIIKVKTKKIQNLYHTAQIFLSENLRAYKIREL